MDKARVTEINLLDGLITGVVARMLDTTSASEILGTASSKMSAPSQNEEHSVTLVYRIRVDLQA